VNAGLVKFTSVSFCGKRVFRINIQFCCHLCRSICAIFRNNPSYVRRSLTVNVDFCPLDLIPNVVFPWFMYADVTLETVALDTPNNLAVFVTDVPANRVPTICPLSKSDKSSIFRFFHTDCHSAQSLTLNRSLMHSHQHYRV
jgi:hypothetical protein